MTKALRPIPKATDEPFLETSAAVPTYSAEKARPVPLEIAACILVACLVPLGYTLYTEHVWEDFFITFKYSQNLIDGKGLVYNEGERVHGFTSPLGTLLPALCYLVTGKSSYLPALGVFRLFSIAAFAGGAVFLLKAFRRYDPHRPALAWFCVLLYVLDAKAVAYTVNGMETGFMLFFLAWGVYLLLQGGPAAWLARGACWAGLMWTRPDGCIYIAGLGLAELLFTRGARKQTWVSLLRSAGVCTLLYLPWFLAVWAYYGTPIPHTITAKSLVEMSVWRTIWEAVSHLHERFPAVARLAFLPLYSNDMAGWFEDQSLNSFILALTSAVGLFCALYWLLPLRDRPGRMLSFCFLVLCLYLSYMPWMVFPWYLPPVTMLGLIVLARGTLNLAEAVRGWLPEDALYAHARWAAFVFLGIYALWHLTHLGLTSWQIRIQMREIEWGNRTQLGLWLREHAQPTDRVYLEPVGYIGYFSGLRVLDYPGLVSPEVVRVRREKQLTMAGIVPELRPEWLVVRPWELDALKESFAEFEEQYALAATFDVSEKVAAYPFLPGRSYLGIDLTFHVYQRKGPATLPSGR